MILTSSNTLYKSVRSINNSRHTQTLSSGRHTILFDMVYSLILIVAVFRDCNLVALYKIYIGPYGTAYSNLYVIERYWPHLLCIDRSRRTKTIGELMYTDMRNVYRVDFKINSVPSSDLVCKLKNIAEYL